MFVQRLDPDDHRPLLQRMSEGPYRLQQYVPQARSGEPQAGPLTQPEAPVVSEEFLDLDPTPLQYRPSFEDRPLDGSPPPHRMKLLTRAEVDALDKRVRSYAAPVRVWPETPFRSVDEMTADVRVKWPKLFASWKTVEQKHEVGAPHGDLAHRQVSSPCPNTGPSEAHGTLKDPCGDDWRLAAASLLLSELD